MSNVIQIEDLWKEYRLGVISHGTLYRDLQSWWAKSRGLEDPNAIIQSHTLNRRRSAERDRFFALAGINLGIRQGEMMGVIGRNGAGKSTLLKILSRVTAPSLGEIKIRGRVTSLLEVGTGFHPELTGRENIFLNGAIMGMTRAEVKKKFDEIVDFSEVESFIDTPVKRYSSGMYVKLAFAVAANMEPEILIVDEVLAVGDVQFQKKCLGKMGEVSSKQGRTVLFVSHNLGAIQNLCSRAILIQDGKVAIDGVTRAAVEKYLHGDTEVPGQRVWSVPGEAPGFDNCVRLRSIRALSERGQVKTVFDVREEIAIEIEYEVLKEKHICDAHLYFKDETGQNLFVLMTSQSFTQNRRPDAPGVHRYRCRIPANFMNEGLVRVEYLLCTNPTGAHNASFADAIAFSITDDRNSEGARGSWTREWPESVVRPKFDWEKIV